MNSNLRKWLGWGIVNLAIVALYGLLMRYKIAFNFPFFEQKNLLHAHSHFAFGGWVGHMLYSGLAMLLCNYLCQQQLKKYKVLIALNLIFSYGMLLAFTAQGYKAVAITFSTLSILLAIIYTISFFKDQKYLPANHPSKRWWKAGLTLNVLSSFGPLALAYMLATKNIDHHFYLGSVYFYLHFQYSGWFFFGSMAIAIQYLPQGLPSLKKYFTVLAATAVPTFFLSILWAKLPVWLYIITVVATLLQLVAWVMLAIRIRGWLHRAKIAAIPVWVNWFFYISALAITLKFLLQTVSVIPSISQLVFGFRPIVIAYLHLVLLAVYTLFFIGFLLAQKIIQPTIIAKTAAFIFMVGVLLNEMLLAIQGFAAFAYKPVFFINEMLFGAACLLLLGAAGLIIALFKDCSEQGPALKK